MVDIMVAMGPRVVLVLVLVEVGVHAFVEISGTQAIDRTIMHLVSIDVLADKGMRVLR